MRIESGRDEMGRDMNSQILVTVIMGVYNQHNKAELEAAVRSIQNQTMEEWELIICDDGSDGKAAENLRFYENKDPRIRVLRHEENLGLAATLNICIAQARGKYIARMDADDISRSERLQKQYDFLQEHPEYAFVGCNASLIDENGVWGSRKMPEKPRKKDFLPYSPFIHPSVMVRKEAYEACGGYYVSKETWRCEDYELFMRMYAMGLRGYNMQETLFWYREDRLNYERRKFRYRLDEAKIRHRNFKNLEINVGIGLIYTIRPVAAAVLPLPLLMHIKRRMATGGAAGEGVYSKNIQTELLPQHTAKESGVV